MNKSKKSAFTLIEIIISIAILSAVSGVLLSLFIAAANLNDRAHDTDIASMMCSNAIAISKIEATLEPTDKTYYYDKSWQVSEASAASFRVVLTTRAAHSANLIEIRAIAETSDGKTLVSYQTGHAIRAEEANND